MTGERRDAAQRVRAARRVVDRHHRGRRPAAGRSRAGAACSASRPADPRQRPRRVPAVRRLSNGRSSLVGVLAFAFRLRLAARDTASGTLTTGKSKPISRRVPAGNCSSSAATTSGDSRSTSLAALPADRPADARPEQPQVVVNLGRRADRRSRIANAVLLADRDRRRDALDAVDVRLLHPLEKLAGVGGERLDIPPLPFGVDGVEGERGLPDPLTPVKTMSCRCGSVRSTPFRLCVRAPRTTRRAVRAERPGGRGFGHESLQRAPLADWPSEPCYYGSRGRGHGPFAFARASVLSCLRFNPAHRSDPFIPLPLSP